MTLKHTFYCYFHQIKAVLGRAHIEEIGALHEEAAGLRAMLEVLQSQSEQARQKQGVLHFTPQRVQVITNL